MAVKCSVGVVDVVGQGSQRTTDILWHHVETSGRLVALLEQDAVVEYLGKLRAVLHVGADIGLEQKVHHIRVAIDESFVLVCHQTSRVPPAHVVNAHFLEAEQRLLKYPQKSDENAIHHFCTIAIYKIPACKSFVNPK